MVILAFIVSIFVTKGICKVLFRNTIGTTSGYLGKVIVVWVFSITLISYLLGVV